MIEQKSPFTIYRQGYLDGYLGRDIKKEKNIYYKSGYEDGKQDDWAGLPSRFVEDEDEDKKEISNNT